MLYLETKKFLRWSHKSEVRINKTEDLTEGYR